MSAGVPAITPRHTAMVDYVTEQNSFVVEHTWNFVPWPNDPSLRFRTRNFPIKWESLCDAYILSYQIRKMHDEQYEKMRKDARSALFKVCSKLVVEEKLERFLKSLR